jgi:hypothetical protein
MSIFNKHRADEPLPHPKLTYLPATAHGWQRRPDMDCPGVYVWERPDGSLFASPSEYPPMIVATDGW